MSGCRRNPNLIHGAVLNDCGVCLVADLEKEVVKRVNAEWLVGMAVSFVFEDGRIEVSAYGGDRDGEWKVMDYETEKWKDYPSQAKAVAAVKKMIAKVTK